MTDPSLTILVQSDIDALTGRSIDALLQCLLVSVGLVAMAAIVLIALCCWEVCVQGRKERQGSAAHSVNHESSMAAKSELDQPNSMAQSRDERAPLRLSMARLS